MCDLARRERFGYDPDHFAAGCESGIGDRAHQADATAAVHDAEATRDERPRDGSRAFAIRRIIAVVGTAEDADAHQAARGMARLSVVRTFVMP
ncbi:MAG: hypothetical protein NVSMB19_23890 [Vulcanimicrobiaceae bacterium]